MPEESLDLIAVYGSLLRSEGMLPRLGVARHLEFVRPAVIPGRLLDLGDYPGLRSPAIPPAPPFPSGSEPESVVGELFRVLDPTALALLDAYEGYDARNLASSPFHRVRLRLLEPAVEAWVYIYVGSDAHAPAIPGRSWLEYKSKSAPGRKRG